MDLLLFGEYLLKALLMIFGVMSIAGYAVLVERKVAGWIQMRPGPNRTSLPFIKYIPYIGIRLIRLGLFQPLADVGKFVFKEEPMPGHVNKLYYILAPCISFIPAMTTMTVLPIGVFNDRPMVLANLDIGILFILAVSSLGVYGIVLAGWSANSKYPFLGGIRSSAQLISYELAMGLAILPIFMWTGGTLNIFDAVQSQQHLWFGFIPHWGIIWQPLSALIFLVALFAETNRLPFDMPEAETELVAGYNTEYGAFKFGIFFVAEYTHIVIGSAVFTLLFLGGWTLPYIDYPEGYIGAGLSVAVFLAKVFMLVFFFMWIRWTLPRFRYDQVMRLGWRVLLPLAIGNLIFYAIAIAIYEQFN
ncbi:MAG: complex I subunit 1 family protein [Verrucomicrobiota bacterium]|nr:complex I subunit 1 family protein [Verrucomicrobiota bacterium]